MKKMSQLTSAIQTLLSGKLGVNNLGRIVLVSALPAPKEEKNVHLAPYVRWTKAAPQMAHLAFACPSVPANQPQTAAVGMPSAVPPLKGEEASTFACLKGVVQITAH